MEIRNNVACYDGPPVWILSPECQALIKRIPARQGITRCYMKMADGKIVYDVAVIANTLCELPEPYTCRDIRVIGALKDY